MRVQGAESQEQAGPNPANRLSRSITVEELVVDREVGRIYAEILRGLLAAGTPLPANDIWVAATAARAGATVLTYDRHFEAVQRVGSLILSSP